MIGVWGKHAMRPCGCGEAAGLDLARACCKGARVCVAGAVKVAAGVVICVEINQCGGCTRQYTKSFLGNDVAVLARSSGEEPASPRHRAGVASMAWRTTRDSGRTRRNILISTQVVMIGGMPPGGASPAAGPGYEDCWEDCPLPDPMEFNHNALFHALYAAGLLALAVGVLCDTADRWTATKEPTDPAKELERV